MGEETRKGFTFTNCEDQRTNSWTTNQHPWKMNSLARFLRDFSSSGTECHAGSNAIISSHLLHPFNSSNYIFISLLFPFWDLDRWWRCWCLLLLVLWSSIRFLCINSKYQEKFFFGKKGDHHLVQLKKNTWYKNMWIIMLVCADLYHQNYIYLQARKYFI